LEAVESVVLRNGRENAREKLPSRLKEQELRDGTTWNMGLIRARTLKRRDLLGHGTKGRKRNILMADHYTR
jgi:hypothetical protein